MNFKDIMQIGEKKTAKEDKYCVIPLIWGT